MTARTDLAPDAQEPCWEPVTRSEEERSVATAELLARAAGAAGPVGEAERAVLLGRVVELNMRVAEAVARRYARRGVPTEDLVQVAYLALVRAVGAFEPGAAADGSGERDLLSYAVPSMTGEIRRYFRDHGWTIRPPREVQRAHGRLVRSGMGLDRLDEASVGALAAEVEESVEVVREALVARSCFTLVSLDAPPSPGAGGEVAPDVADVEDRSGAQVEARLMVAPLLAMLAPREREVLRLRFAEERSQRQIAEALGMSQVQVSRLLQRMLTQMRTTLGVGMQAGGAPDDMTRVTSSAQVPDRVA